ncbi:MAG: hypothetical protein AB1941_00310 [Gemmatimonadota bacterium]
MRDELDPVAALFLRAKQALSSPLYVVLRDSPVWTSYALAQWATGRRRPKSSKLREVALDLHARAEAMERLAHEFEEMADRMDRGEVAPRRRMRRE